MINQFNGFKEGRGALVYLDFIGQTLPHEIQLKY